MLLGINSTLSPYVDNAHGLAGVITARALMNIRKVDSMNKIFLSGNLTKDPESKTYNGNITVAKTAIAVARNFSKNNETDFFNIVAFSKTADFLCKYFSKGRRVLIEGRLQTSNYTDKDGNSRTGYDVIVDNIEFADSKKKDSSADDGKNYNPDDNDLPF